MYCKHCHQHVYQGVTHYCQRARREIIATSDSSDFSMSLALAMATDNAMVGFAAGGDLSGALLGQAIADSMQSTTCDTSTPDTSSNSCDTSSSFYSGGGSSGGGGSDSSW